MIKLCAILNGKYFRLGTPLLYLLFQGTLFCTGVKFTYCGMHSLTGQENKRAVQFFPLP